ncbi:MULTISPECIES: hypothetical protein [unclassified Burkholderia]|uniref:hypothetical protein n=1 Tax=unclassified Burkholderia TaxID=2613784 RepID=UPI001FC7D880|nr:MULTISPECIES: hypothetical protein [unclassified Burkholderia]
MLLAADAPSMQHGNGLGIVTVSAPQPLSAGKASVTLWDEIPPPHLPMPLPAPQPAEMRHAPARSAQADTHP